MGGGWIGYLGYPDGYGALPEAAGGWTDCVLRLDLDNCWWFESLSGAPCPPGLTAAVAVGAAESSWHLDWLTPDAAAHQHRAQQCLAAIADGEVYQACVCTRFAGNLDGEAVQLFASGIEADEPARAAYLAGPWGAVASFSPERRPAVWHLVSTVEGKLRRGVTDAQLLEATFPPASVRWHHHRLRC